MTDYKLVPVEPTSEMLAAGEYALEAGCYASGIYADMLAASPGVQGDPVLHELQLWAIRNHVAINEVTKDDDSMVICVKHGRAVERAVIAALQSAPQPAEQKPVCPTCPTCYGRGWDMDCQNEFRPATCPDCAGSGKAEQSITVQESDSAAPDVAGLVEALELAQGFLRNKGYPEEDPLLLGAINAVLTAHRKGGE